MTTAKQKVLENLKNTYCRLMPSKIDGIGVFAIRDIPINTNPFYGSPIRRWVKIKPDDYKNLHKGIKKNDKRFFCNE